MICTCSLPKRFSSMLFGSSSGQQVYFLSFVCLVLSCACMYAFCNF